MPKMNKIILTIAALLVVAFLAWRFGPLEGPTDNGEPSNQPDQQQEQDNRAGWNEYESQAIGFRLEYPEEVTARETDTEATFTLIGDTQAEGTELFDGIMFSVRRISYQTSLQAYMEADVEQNRDLGEITAPLKETTLAGQKAYTYSANTLGAYTHYFLDRGDNEALVISYINPDPTNQGYEEITSEMLKSFGMLN